MITGESSSIITVDDRLVAPALLTRSARSAGNTTRSVVSGTLVVDAKGQRQWMLAFLPVALAEKYAASTIAVAMALFELHFNRKTGQCNPGYPKLATELGCTERTIFRAVDALEAGGWLKRLQPGQHQNVEFTFTIPASSGVTTAVISEQAPEVTRNGSRGDNCCHPFNEEHLNTGKHQHRSRPSQELMFAQIEARSRAENEKRRRRQ